MYSMPSSRNVASICLIALLTITAFRLLVELHTVPWLDLYHLHFEQPPYFHSQPANQFQNLNERFKDQMIEPMQPFNNRIINLLTKCTRPPNTYTNHIRYSHARIHNISTAPLSVSPVGYFNPAIIPLPSHASAQYLLVSRVVTAGFHQESHMCFADFCDTETQDCPPPGRSGLFCKTTPVKVNIPPTPAFRCTGKWGTFVEIPGFHDPRLFWSGKGEPLIEVNSGSQYGCVGLWLQDLRAIYPELEETLEQKSDQKVGPVIAYRHLTELTRNPRDARNEIEKNWVLFFPRDDAWIQYDIMGKTTDERDLRGQLLDKRMQSVSPVRNLANASASVYNTWSHPEPMSTPVISKPGPHFSAGRTIAQLSSHGFSTENLTSPHEQACFDVTSQKHNFDALGKRGHWHQGTNSLRLIACTRAQMRRRQCHPSPSDEDLRQIKHDEYEDFMLRQGSIIHFSFIHRKFTGAFAPVRYERYLLLWEARKPFQTIGVSRYPILFGSEIARPWNDNVSIEGLKVNPRSEADLVDDPKADTFTNAGSSRYFTYTPSIAWAWRKNGEDGHIHNERGHEDLGTGYLEDEIIIGIGVDDVAQGIVKAPISELLECIRLCK